MYRFVSLRLSAAALSMVALLGLASPAPAGEQVPLKGKLEADVFRGELVFPYVPVLLDGGGTATHLGKFTFLMPHTVDVRDRIAIGTYYIVAANGDLLVADVTGKATPVPGTAFLDIEETATISPEESTGRFAGATGSFKVIRRYDTVAGTTVGYFEGTISSPGASK